MLLCEAALHCKARGLMMFMHDVIMVGEKGEKGSGAFSDKILMFSLGDALRSKPVGLRPCLLFFII